MRHPDDHLGMLLVAQTDRRRVRRTYLALPVTVRSGARSLKTHTVDVSLDGILLACVGLAGAVQLSVGVPGSGGRLELAGEVVRQEPGRTAVRFAQPLGRSERLALGLPALSPAR